MALATVNEFGRPTARMVVLAGFDQNGFDFATDAHSPKIQDAQRQPWVALVFYWAELERQVYEAGKAILDKLAAEGRASGVEVDVQLLSGPAAEAIAQAAQPDDVDFVVVGSRGRTLVSSILLGGTSHRLVHICKKPIMIVH